MTLSSGVREVGDGRHSLDHGSDLTLQSSTPPSFAFFSRSHRRTIFYAGLALGDFLAIILGLGGTAMLYSGRFADGAPIIALFLLIYLMVAFQMGAFNVTVLGNWMRGLRRTMSALVLTGLIVIAAGFALKVSDNYSRVIMLAGCGQALLLAALLRYMLGALAKRAFADGVIGEVVLSDGSADVPTHTRDVIYTDSLDLRPTLDCPHMLDRLGQAVSQVDRVVIACAPEARLAWASTLRGLGISVEILIPEAEELGLLGLNRFGDNLTGVVARGPLALRDRVAKRVLDLAVLIVLLPGLLIATTLIAIAIKLDEGGPIFFVQKRIGQGNRIFNVFKFRSMTVAHSDSSGSVSASRTDKRVTRVGRILRRTSLDELPQLFNVLLGDMSLVGPRPHALGSLAGDALFWDADIRYFYRHAAKPGLTGLAQVRGLRGATDTIAALSDRVQSDLEYLNGWSLWRDLRILVLTLKVLIHKNAY